MMCGAQCVFARLFLVSERAVRSSVLGLLLGISKSHPTTQARPTHQSESSESWRRLLRIWNWWRRLGARDSCWWVTKGVIM